MTDKSIEARKQAAVEFLRLVVAGYRDEAYERYVDREGKHHNPSFPAGFTVLKKAMLENHLRFPNKQIMVRNVIGEGDLVAVHSHILQRPGEKGMITVHLFRFDDDKIIVFWDCGQPLPADSPNKDGAF